MELFEVDVLVSFRNKYIIEAETLKDAYDELVMTENDRKFGEITQKFLGEHIISGQQTTHEGVVEIINRLKEDESELCSPGLIHKVDYTK
jgi:hypothetical protein